MAWNMKKDQSLKKTLTELKNYVFSGTDSGFIECLHTGPVDFINSYCYIMGTFSVRDKYVGTKNKVIFIIH